MSSVTETNLEKKFQHVSNTQDSIQSFSLWIIHHKSHCKKIIDVWMKMLRKTKVNHRLTLLYLANDVIQNARRKGVTQFSETFTNILPEATVFLRDDKIKGSVERVFNIWENRNVFSSEFIDGLKNTLNNSESKSDATAKIISEYKPESLTDKIRKNMKVGLETTSKLSALNGSKLDAANSEVLRQFKDRSHGQQFSRDFEEATRCLEEYIAALTRENAERAEVIELIEQAVIYYSNQSGEARIVANAYKSFSARVTAQKKKIEGLIALLPSPFPSPCVDAPSPTNSDDGLDLAANSAVPAPLVDEDAPSPEGSPEDLQLTPGRPQQALSPDPTLDPRTTSPAENLGKFSPVDHLKFTPDHIRLTPDHLKMSPAVSSNSNIPVSSFLGTQGAGLMSSWLETFNKSLKSNSDQPKDNKLENSLDSRLLNLIQSIPSSVPSALLAGVGGETPVKDEWTSGQGTPVQDEDEPLDNPLLKHLGQYNSPNQTQWPSALPPNPTQIEPSQPQEEIVKPLQPPPKPSFACLGLLSSPLRSSSLSNSPTPGKVRVDPRLASQNFSTTSSVNTSISNVTKTVLRSSQRREDINSELMDMDLGESDEDEEKTKEKNECETETTPDEEKNASREDPEVVNSKTEDSSEPEILEEIKGKPKEVSVTEVKTESYNTFSSFVGDDRRFQSKNKNEGDLWPADELKTLLAESRKESNMKLFKAHDTDSRNDSHMVSHIEPHKESQIELHMDMDLHVGPHKTSNNNPQIDSHIETLIDRHDESKIDSHAETRIERHNDPQTDLNMKQHIDLGVEKHMDTNTRKEQHRNVNMEQNTNSEQQPNLLMEQHPTLHLEPNINSHPEQNQNSRPEQHQNSRMEQHTNSRLEEHTNSLMEHRMDSMNSPHVDSRMDSRIESLAESHRGSQMDSRVVQHIQSLAADSRMDMRMEPQMDLSNDPHVDPNIDSRLNSQLESRIQTIQSVRNDDWRPVHWEDSQQMGYNYRHQQQQQPQFRQQHQNYQQQNQFPDRRPYDRPYHEQEYPQGYPPAMLGGPKRFPGPFNGRGGRGYFVPRY